MRSPRREATEATQFRALAARENFLLTYRLDIQFSVERAVPFHVEANKEIGLVSNVWRDTYWRSHARFGCSAVSFPKSLTYSLIPIGGVQGVSQVDQWRCGGSWKVFVAELEQYPEIRGDFQWRSGILRSHKSSGGLWSAGCCRGHGLVFQTPNLGDSTTARAVANRTGSRGFARWSVRAFNGRWVAESTGLGDQRLGETEVSRLVEMVGGRLVARSANRRWADMTGDVQFEQPCVSFFVTAGMRPRAAGVREGRLLAERERERETHPLILRTSVVD